MAQDLLIPVQKQKVHEGRFQWPTDVTLCSPFLEDHLPLRQLATRIRQETDTRSTLSRNHLKPSTLLVRRHAGIKNPQGYRITITKQRIEVLAPTAAAAYYAIQTLRELVRIHGKQLPCCQIDDHPDMRRRGVYLDCSRGKVPTLETLKLLIEYLASVKVNELQLYVENVFTFASHPSIGRGFSPFTVSDLLTIQDTCKLHHIRLVPSLTSFGHFEKILALPEYSHLGEAVGGGGSTLCPTDRGSIELVADMYADFLPLFEAVDFNACGDEPWELGKGRSKRRAERLGVGRVYLDFIKKLHKQCEKHGKRMNLWSDIVLNHPEVIPDIPKDIVMLNWDYFPNGSRSPRTHEFVKVGLDVVVCPGTSAWKHHGTQLQNAIDNVRVVAKVGRQYAAEGLLNTDWGDGGHRSPIGTSFHAYAHGAAHAWNGGAVDDTTFTETFCYHVLATTTRAVPQLIRDIGRVSDTVQTLPYYIIGMPIAQQRRYTTGISPASPVNVLDQEIEQADMKGCRDILSALQRAIATLSKEAPATPVARLVVEDLALAAQLDTLGCRKLQVMRDYQDRGAVDTRACRDLLKTTRQTATRFESNWRKRNRPSRISDNLRLFKEGAKELERLSTKR